MIAVKEVDKDIPPDESLGSTCRSVDQLSDTFAEMFLENIVLRMRHSQLSDVRATSDHRPSAANTDIRCVPRVNSTTIRHAGEREGDESHCSCCSLPKHCKRSVMLDNRFLCPCDIDVSLYHEPDWLVRTAKLLRRRLTRHGRGNSENETQEGLLNHVCEDWDDHQSARDPDFRELLVALTAAADLSSAKGPRGVNSDSSMTSGDLKGTRKAVHPSVYLAGRNGCTRVDTYNSVEGKKSKSLGSRLATMALASLGKNTNNSSSQRFDQRSRNDDTPLARNRLLPSQLMGSILRGPNVCFTDMSHSVVCPVAGVCPVGSIKSNSSNKGREGGRERSGLRYGPRCTRSNLRLVGTNTGELSVNDLKLTPLDKKWSRVKERARRHRRGIQARRCICPSGYLYMNPHVGAEPRLCGTGRPHVDRCYRLPSSLRQSWGGCGHQVCSERGLSHRYIRRHVGRTFIRQGCRASHGAKEKKWYQRARLVGNRSHQRMPGMQICAQSNHNFLYQPPCNVTAMNNFTYPWKFRPAYSDQSGIKGQIQMQPETRNNSCLGSSYIRGDRASNSHRAGEESRSRPFSNPLTTHSAPHPGINGRDSPAPWAINNTQNPLQFTFSIPHVVADVTQNSPCPPVSCFTNTQNNGAGPMLDCSSELTGHPQRVSADRTFFKPWGSIRQADCQGATARYKNLHCSQNITIQSGCATQLNNMGESPVYDNMLGECCKNNFKKGLHSKANNYQNESILSRQPFPSANITSTGTFYFRRPIRGEEDMTTNNNNTDFTHHVNNNSSSQPQARARIQLSGQVVRVEGDGRCLFRSLVTAEHPALQLVGRDEFGRPVTRELADQETMCADQLRARVVELMSDNMHFYSQLERGVINADQPIPSSYQRFRDRLSAMSDPTTMPGDLELNAVALVMERQILVLDTNLTIITSYGHDRYPMSLPLAVRYTRLVADVGHYDAVILEDDHLGNVNGQRDSNSSRGHQGSPLSDPSMHSGLCVEFRRLTTSGRRQRGHSEGRSTSCPRDATLNAKKEFFYLRDTDKALHCEGLQPVSASTESRSGQRTAEAATSTASAVVRWSSSRMSVHCAGKKVRACSEKHTQTDWGEEAEDETRWVAKVQRFKSRRQVTRIKKTSRRKPGRAPAGQHQSRRLKMLARQNINWNSRDKKSVGQARIWQNTSSNAVKCRRQKTRLRAKTKGKVKGWKKKQPCLRTRNSHIIDRCRVLILNKDHWIKKGRTKALQTKWARRGLNIPTPLPRRRVADRSTNSNCGGKGTPMSYIQLCAPTRKTRSEKPESRGPGSSNSQKRSIAPGDARRNQSVGRSTGRNFRRSRPLSLSRLPSRLVLPDRPRLPDAFDLAVCRCVLCNNKVDASARDAVKCYLCGRIAHRACVMASPGGGQGGGDQNYFLCVNCVPL